VFSSFPRYNHRLIPLDIVLREGGFYDYGKPIETWSDYSSKTHVARKKKFGIWNCGFAM
jgi:hypothetical protein